MVRNCKEQRKWKRIILSSLLIVLADETYTAAAFCPARSVVSDRNRRILTLLHEESKQHQHSRFAYRSSRQHQLMHLKEYINDDIRGPTSSSLQNLDIIESELASWSTQQLLSALNERGIRYAPTASRTDLEMTLMDYLKYNNNNGSSASTGILDPNRKQRQNNVNPVTNPVENVAASVPQADLQDRMHKRVERRLQQQTRRDQFRGSMSNVLFNAVPSVTGNVLDFTKRKARRWKRQFADFMLLDEETGIRDVVRYDYVRRDQARNDFALKSEVVLGPGDAIEVIVMDAPTQRFPSDEKLAVSGNHGNVPPDEQLFTASVHPSKDRASSIRVAESNMVDNSNSFRLPPSANGHEDSHTSFSSSRYIPPSKKKRNKQNTHHKKVYNPYREEKREILDDDKDAIDKVADFLTKSADQIFDRILWNGDGTERHPRDTRRSTADSQIPFDETSTSARNQHAHRTTNQHQNRRSPRRHWKDRLEERLDSMLGLHETGDFYRSWTERHASENDVDDAPFDAFAVAQGRKPPKRRRKTLYDKPFWEEDGNIISLLFGRTQHYTPPRLDLTSGFPSGSLLAVFRFVLQNFVMVASYLCRWASTQGALPQPVVVFGVGSAMLCARPHRRLFAAGIALLLLRTVGEVLHGYVYGNSGWEEEDDGDDNETSSTTDKSNAETEQYHDEY